MNDFGPQSVDGWLASLVAAEIGIDASAILDREAHEAVMRASSAAHEAGARSFRLSAESRKQCRFAGVTPRRRLGIQLHRRQQRRRRVIRSLRKKLGDRSAVIETVSGVGYRVRELTS